MTGNKSLILISLARHSRAKSRGYKAKAGIQCEHSEYVFKAYLALILRFISPFLGEFIFFSTAKRKRTKRKCRPNRLPFGFTAMLNFRRASGTRYAQTVLGLFRQKPPLLVSL
jgi:hypothetical protein